MQFYRITHPDGRLEFSTVGTEAAKRAKEVGGQSESIEVDTTKPSLLKFFNDLAGSAPVVDTSSANEPADAPIEHVHRDQQTACPKCKFTPRVAESYVANRIKSLNVDALKQWIDTREGWELSTVVEAITYRLGELVATATGKKPV